MAETSGLGRLYSQRQEFKRWVPAFISSHRTLFTLLWILGFASLFMWQRSIGEGFWFFAPISTARSIPNMRSVAFNLTDFGAKGDGKTINTGAFEKAVAVITKLRTRGGGQLNVPAGYWLTAPFNLTSHMTLFLAEGAVILAIQNMHFRRHPDDRSCKLSSLLVMIGEPPHDLLNHDTHFRQVEDEKYWPLMPALPSYGYGRERPGPRYGSLIHGQNLKDVVITGHNGTIDGQGQTWWIKHRQKLLNYTRGPLVQIMWSSDIQISNITLRDSPFWNIHPYDCKNVTITNVTILAPVFGAPNTDGIDPDSCNGVLIEDCYISVGDDGIAIKSGWDQYGIAYGQPSTNILIRNLLVQSMVSAGISIGSEMSGGVSNVTIENVRAWNSRRGMRIKTAPGRGGHVRHIAYRNLTFDNVRVGIVIKTDYNEHADDGYDRNAFPILGNISFIGVHGQGVRVPVRLHGTEDIPLRNLTFKDMSVGTTYKKKHIFQCAFVQGRVIGTIFPAPCDNLDLYDEQGKLVKRSSSQNVTDIDYDF